MREEFEDWAVSDGAIIDKNDSGEYTDPNTASAFAGYGQRQPEIDALIHDNARLLESLNAEAKERRRLEDENVALAAAPTPPAQEDGPYLWECRQQDLEIYYVYATQMAELMIKKGYEITALYTRPQSDNLRKAAEEVVSEAKKSGYLTPAIDGLLIALEGK